MSVQFVITTADPSDIFHLPLSTQAREEIRQIQADAGHVLLNAGTKDNWTCSLGQPYMSRKFYAFCFRDVPVDKVFQWIWKSECPIKYKVFCWLLLVDRLNTRNMLRRRHYNVANNNYACLLCDSPPEETVEHLFFSCPFSQQCWRKLGFSWPNSNNRIQLIHGGRETWSGPMFMDIFIMATWSIWKERNDKHFRRIPQSQTSWLARFKNSFGLLIHTSKHTLHPFILSLLQSI